jgi:vitamin B12 transporter
MELKEGKKLNIALAIAISLGCLSIFPQKAIANEDYVDPAEQTSMSFALEGITVEARRPDWETKLSPGSVTVVHPDDFKGEQKIYQICCLLYLVYMYEK